MQDFQLVSSSSTSNGAACRKLCNLERYRLSSMWEAKVVQVRYYPKPVEIQLFSVYISLEAMFIELGEFFGRLLYVGRQGMITISLLMISSCDGRQILPLRVFINCRLLHCWEAWNLGIMGKLQPSEMLLCAKCWWFVKLKNLNSLHIHDIDGLQSTSSQGPWWAGVFGWFASSWMWIVGKFDWCTRHQIAKSLPYTYLCCTKDYWGSLES